MAMETGSAVFMPYFLQGMDFAATMLLRSDGSPDTTDGTRRISRPPSDRIFTADQDTNALFTSMWNTTLFDDIQGFSDLDECFNGFVEMFPCMCCGQLDPYARLSLRYDRVVEPRYENAFLCHCGGEFLA